MSKTAELFVEILNNTNDMKPQEIRNAITGLFSSWVRDIARGNGKTGKQKQKPHKLFEVVVEKGKNVLKHFGRFTLRGRMEIDEWVSELVYMWTHGWKTGVSQNLIQSGRKTSKAGIYEVNLLIRKN